ncbi:MAG: hypothetical protein VX740_04360 [Pseudomonadota bacterium]|nr:hypothetical protein [Pseudomonadota bacterium]MED5422654.1 hypothetical protein [Pseudomonadota bacterium]
MDQQNAIDAAQAFEAEAIKYYTAREAFLYNILFHLEDGADATKNIGLHLCGDAVCDIHFDLLDHNEEYKQAFDLVMQDKAYIIQNCYGANETTYYHAEVEALLEIAQQEYYTRFIDIYDDVSIDTEEVLTTKNYTKMLEALSNNKCPVSDSRLKHHFGKAAEKHIELLKDDSKYSSLFNKVVRNTAEEDLIMEGFKHHTKPAWQQVPLLLWAAAKHLPSAALNNKRIEKMAQIALNC